MIAIETGGVLSSSQSESGQVSWGMISAIVGCMALLTNLFGCLMGLGLASLPMSALGIWAGRMQLRESTELDESDTRLAKAGIFLSLVPIVLHVIWAIAALLMFVVLFLSMFSMFAVSAVTVLLG